MSGRASEENGGIRRPRDRAARGKPPCAFVAAIGIAVLAAVLDTGSNRAPLAPVGTVGGTLGWWSVERPIVRRRVVAAFRRLHPTASRETLLEDRERNTYPRLAPPLN